MEMKQLPGLLKLERESLSLLCSLLYKTYNLKKANKTPYNKELHCYIVKIVEVMEKFSEKQVFLTKRIAKQQKLEPEPPQLKPTQSQSEDHGTMNKSYSKRKISFKLDEDYLENIRNLSVLEEERKLINLRKTLSKDIFPILNQIEFSDLESSFGELLPALINISKFSLVKCYSCSVCQNCQNCENILHTNLIFIIFIILIILKIFIIFL